MIRAATLEDLPALSHLHGACFAAPWSAEEFARLLASPGCFALVAEPSAAPTGFVLARVAADEAEILSIGIAPGHRRGGLGRALALAAAAEAVRRSARAMFLEVAVDNAPAQALYAQLGFRAVGRRPDYYNNKTQSADALTLKALLPLEQSAVGNPRALD